MQQLGVPELVHMRQHCSTAAWRSGVGSHKLALQQLGVPELVHCSLAFRSWVTQASTAAAWRSGVGSHELALQQLGVPELGLMSCC
jgi:hypothetical protein